MSTPQRLWDKGAPLEQLVHRFTVGDDPLIDRELVHWDCLGSAAHARTLHRAGLLSDSDLALLLAGLARIDALSAAGKFDIPPELEDCHTAIEAHLTRECGEAGGRIHTGRSRNDQVAVAMRLFMRHRALAWLELLHELGAALLARIERDGGLPMPGYTHLQPAMPTTTGQWLLAHAEGVLEQCRAALDLLSRLDSCPLGSGAGFGVSLPLDREYTARLLGFARAQRAVADVQNSRGRLELYFVRVGADAAAVLEKLSWDLVLFATAEFGFVALPEELTTGSSIMPQKRNPDALELLRAHAGRLRARQHELEWVAGKLPSGYHRDLQLTKSPAVRTADDVAIMLRVATRLVSAFAWDADRLRAALRPELYATHAAYALVRQGVPFREAYRRVGEQLRAGSLPLLSGADAASTGDVTAALVAEARGELAELQRRAREWSERCARAERSVLEPAQ